MALSSRVGIAAVLLMLAGAPTASLAQLTPTAKDAAKAQMREAAADIRLRQNAQKGDVAAMVELGRHEVYEGDQAAGVKWFEKAAAAKNPEGQFMLGMAYAMGWGGLKRDHAKGFPYFEQAARSGHALAATMCGMILEDGALGKPDLVRAAFYFKEAAKHNEPRAMTHLGYFALEGKGGVKKDERAAVDWFTTAAHHGHVEAVRMLALFHIDGVYGVEKNEKEGARLLHIASDAGDLHAKLLLARAYRVGKWGVHENAEKSTRLLRELAKDGDVPSMVQLAAAYRDGIGIAPNAPLAVEWWEKAVAAGSTEAMITYGLALKMGEKGISKDETRAYRLFEQAAAKGDTFGMIMLAACMKDGTGGVKDPKKAFELLAAAEKAGNPLACGGLAIMYADGDGTARNPVKADAMFKQTLKQRPKHAGALGNYAWFLLGEGRREDGFKQLTAAFENINKDTSAELQAELWFYVLAFQPERREEALTHLRSLVQEKTVSEGWNFTRVINQALKAAPRHPDAKWLPKLADVISGKSEASALAGWEAWDQQPRQATVPEVKE